MRLENLCLEGAGFVGGNAISRSRFTNLRGKITRRVIDCGFVSIHNELDIWTVTNVGSDDRGEPMFQCSECSADNYFHDITVNGDAAMYSELVRLNRVRAFSRKARSAPAAPCGSTGQAALDGPSSN